jgi:hypothetical protein
LISKKIKGIEYRICLEQIENSAKQKIIEEKEKEKYRTMKPKY